MTEPNIIEQFENDLFGATSRIIAQRSQAVSRPQTLYHFTDAAGLTGICSSRTLRLHLVGTSNDASEGVYAIELAKEVARSSHFQTAAYRSSLLRQMETADRPETATVAIDHYIACLCEREDSALHWLHYGRRGTGYALAMNPSELHRDNFVLVKVLYRPDDQRKLLEELFRTVHDVFQMYCRTHRFDNTDLWDNAGRFAADQARLFRSQFKHEAFEAEKEWRIVTLETSDKSIRPENDISIPVEFNQRASQVVPFIPMPLTHSAFNGIVCGFSSSHARDTRALDILSEDKLGRKLSIETSKVPIRP